MEQELQVGSKAHLSGTAFCCAHWDVTFFWGGKDSVFYDSVADVLMIRTMREAPNQSVP